MQNTKETKAIELMQEYKDIIAEIKIDGYDKTKEILNKESYIDVLDYIPKILYKNWKEMESLLYRHCTPKLSIIEQLNYHHYKECLTTDNRLHLCYLHIKQNIEDFRILIKDKTYEVYLNNVQDDEQRKEFKKKFYSI